MERKQQINALVVLGGTISDRDFYHRLMSEHDFIIGADCGCELIRELGHVPDLAVGDFDSVSNETLMWLRKQAVEIRQYPRKKDQTDGELALEAAATAGASRVTITATQGGRIDHILGNLFLLRLAQKMGVDCRVVEANREVLLLNHKAEIEGSSGDIVSIIPLERCVGVTIEGFAYTATMLTLEPGSTRGLSNVLIDERGKINIVSGQALIVRSKPQEIDESRQ